MWSEFVIFCIWGASVGCYYNAVLDESQVFSLRGRVMGLVRTYVGAQVQHSRLALTIVQAGLQASAGAPRTTSTSEKARTYIMQCNCYL